LRFAIAVGRFYEDLAERLVEGATRVFEEAGADVDVHDVPGAFELPLAARYCADSGRYEGVACLGAVIRGETSHDRHVAESAARGIEEVAIATGIPVTLGVITAETTEQAEARSQPGTGRNMGADAARAAVEMASLAAKLKAGA